MTDSKIKRKKSRSKLIFADGDFSGNLIS